MTHAADVDDWGQWISWNLEEGGYNVTTATWDLVPGTFVPEFEQKAVDAADLVLVIVSPGLASSEASREWLAAWYNRNTVIPVEVNRCEPPPMLRMLKKIDLVDYTSDEAGELLRTEVAKAVRGSARPDLPPRYPGIHTHRPEPVYPGHEPDSFSSWVGEAFLARNRDAVIVRSARGGRVPFLEAERQRPNGNVRRWLVGLAPDGLNDDRLAAFFAELSEFRGRYKEWPEAELVYGGRLADEDLVHQARERGVAALSLAQYDGQWDFREYRNRQRERFETDLSYHHKLYVPQRFEVLSGASTDSGAGGGDLYRQVIDWLSQDTLQFVLVMGSFGHGKTFLLRELARRLGDTDLPGVAPILIELREVDRRYNIDTLLSSHLAKEGEDVKVRTVRRMVERGRAVILFDGFDELAANLTYETATEYLKLLLDVVDGRAKVVLTSRTQHFYDDNQMDDVLRQRIPEANWHKVKISGFDEGQISDYLTRLFRHRAQAAEQVTGVPPDERSSPAEADAKARDRRRFIDENGLRELSENPRMLSFVAMLDDAEMATAAARRPGPMTPTALYETVVTHWLENEARRRPELTIFDSSLDAAALRTAVERLALTMWESGKDTIDRDGLLKVSQSLEDLYRGRLDPPHAAFVIGSGSLLVRDRPDKFAIFSFGHRTVLEFLVTSEVARRSDLPSLRHFFQRHEISDVMVDFFHGAPDTSSLARWAAAELRADDTTRVLRLNALRVAERLGIRVPDRRLRGVSLAGQTVSGQDWTLTNLAGADLVRTHLSWMTLTGADLTGADLRDARIEKTDLRDANLRDANLSGGRLVDVDMTGADLTGTSLRGAELVEPRLAGARLGGGDWRRAAVLTRRPGALPVAPELSQATVTGRDQIDCQTAPAAAEVHAFAFSPDGTMLAVVLDDGVGILDVATCRFLRLLPNPHGAVTGHAVAVAFARDGTVVVAFGGDGTVIVWDTAGPKVEASSRRPGGAPPASGQRGGTVVVSGDGGTNAWQPGAETEIAIRDTLSGRRRCRVDPSRCPPALNADGTLVATSRGRHVLVWDARTGEQTASIDNEALVSTLCFGGSRLFGTSNGDPAIRIWDPTTGARIAGLPGSGGGHSAGGLGDVRAVTADQTGRTLAVVHTASPRAGATSVPRLGTWSVDTGAPVASLRLRDHVRGIGPPLLSATGAHAAAVIDDGLVLWDVGGRGSHLPFAQPHCAAVAMSGSGTRMAAAAGRTTIVWDTATGAELRRFDTDGRPTALALDHDGNRLAVSDQGRTVHLVAVEPARPADPSRPAPRWYAGSGTVRSLAFGPDDLLVACFDDGRVSVLDRLGNSAAGVRTGDAWHDGAIVAAVHDRRQRQIVTADDQGRLRLAPFPVPTSPPRLWAGPRGTLALAYWRARLVALTVAGGVATVRHAGPGRAMAGLGARNTDVATVVCTAPAPPFAGDVRAAAFGAGGAMFATAHADGNVRLWQTDGGELLATVVLSADGGRAVLDRDGGFCGTGDRPLPMWGVMKLHRLSTRTVANLDGVLQPLSNRRPIRQVLRLMERGDGRGRP